MSRSSRHILVTVAVSAALFGTALPSFPPPPGELPFGVYDPNGDFSDEQNVQVEHLFLPWEDLFLESLTEADKYAKERNREVLVTIEPWTWTRDARNTPARLIRGIRDGTYDGNMAAICEVLNRFESKVTVRWAQEMDDNSGQFIWAQWQPETYVYAFKRMIDVCRDKAPEIRVMWSPLGYENLNKYYPGDDYVDIIGLSVFGLQPWEQIYKGGEMSFDEIFAPRYERVKEYGKPVMVAELGYSGDEAYVARWEQTVRQDKSAYPALTGIVYFNQQEVYPWPNGFGLPDWRVEHRIRVETAGN
ncbi:glycoside hydrolase family 26 protein [Leisingera sp. ANG-S5]|uniref:glycoside hydrolase family 26 protein n=1 Tax=Leisingera sp. ANG-S5 TaxID=1577901 RepID=UPI00057F5705|nr:glycosyl hydrolase [Leisingera sp. ANG-S5]KIC33188.1 beta-mannosidase [Leisingera sp. ANG-S5]